LAEGATKPSRISDLTPGLRRTTGRGSVLKRKMRGAKLGRKCREKKARGRRRGWKKKFQKKKNGLGARQGRSVIGGREDLFFLGRRKKGGCACSKERGAGRVPVNPRGGEGDLEVGERQGGKDFLSKKKKKKKTKGGGNDRTVLGKKKKNRS